MSAQRPRPGLVGRLVLAASVVLAGLTAGAAEPAPAAPAKPAGAAASGRMNVLLICVDDLRPEIACFGKSDMKTPNLDALAARGMRFDRAYVQQAVCSPSRTCLLTGLRPDQTKVYDLETHFRTTIPDVVTLPQQFAAAGYQTQSFGKIYHGGLDDEASWTRPSFKPTGGQWQNADTLADMAERTKALKPEQRGKKKFQVRGPAWEAGDAPDAKYADGQVAAEAVKVMEELKDEPFFLAVGFVKPHLPFCCPKTYYDLYPEASVSVPDNQHPPADYAPLSLTTFSELRSYTGIPKEGPVPPATVKDLNRAYRACVSFTDANVGTVLAGLDRLGLTDKTLIVFWGDHGWKLGEHGQWTKHSNFELDTRTPILVVDPGREGGRSTDRIVETVDIYPTLCDLAAVAKPSGLAGRSLVPLLDDPAAEADRTALSQYPRGEAMGYSLRTDHYRYTEWRARKSGEVLESELYDHRADPDEDVNLAGRGEQAEVVKTLHGQLDAKLKATGSGGPVGL